MPAPKLLVGSLSNDLFRVATLAQRGARRFLMEAKRWGGAVTKETGEGVYTKDRGGGGGE